MKVFSIGLAVLAALVPTAAVAQESSIQRAAWLTGCWMLTQGDRTVEEHWSAPRGGVMLAAGRTVRAGKLAEFEFVILREDGSALVYEARPSGQPFTAFRSTTITESSLVFENLEHDFPQRVGYQRRDTSLTAYIEGPVNGETRRIEFRYQRVPCDQP